MVICSSKSIIKKLKFHILFNLCEKICYLKWIICRKHLEIIVSTDIKATIDVDNLSQFDH